MTRTVFGFPFIWADRLALTLIAIVVAGIALSWAMVAVAAGVEGADHVFAITGLSWLFYGTVAIALLWIVLRAIDFVCGGPTRALVSMHWHRAQRNPSLGKDDTPHFAGQ